MIKRYYTALYGDTVFEFISEHRAGSQGNLDDARSAARRNFGKLHNTVHSIALRPNVDDAPLGTIAKDLSLSDEERAEILKGFSDGILKRAYMGAKVDGLLSFSHIKAAHGWSWNDFQRAVQDLH